MSVGCSRRTQRGLLHLIGACRARGPRVTLPLSEHRPPSRRNEDAGGISLRVNVQPGRSVRCSGSAGDSKKHYPTAEPMGRGSGIVVWGGEVNPVGSPQDWEAKCAVGSRVQPMPSSWTISFRNKHPTSRGETRASSSAEAHGPPTTTAYPKHSPGREKAVRRKLPCFIASERWHHFLAPHRGHISRELLESLHASEHLLATQRCHCDREEDLPCAIRLHASAQRRPVAHLSRSTPALLPPQ